MAPPFNWEDLWRQAIADDVYGDESLRLLGVPGKDGVDRGTRRLNPGMDDQVDDVQRRKISLYTITKTRSDFKEIWINFC
jgi:hypothetical protein